MKNAWRNLPPSEKHRFLRYRMMGQRRAAFWRALGFPNLVRARARAAELRAQRVAKEQQAAAERADHLDAFMESTRDDL